MKITWVNETTTRGRGTFISLRCHREGDGTIRLNLYFSAHAAGVLSLRRGERLLVGLDEAGTHLCFRPTLFGGNVIKGREVDDALQCMVTLPLQTLPAPQAVRESDVTTSTEHMAVPFAFDPQPLKCRQDPPQLRAAA